MTDVLLTTPETEAAPAVPPAPVAPAPPSATVAPLADVIAKPARRSSRGTSLLMVVAGAVAVGGIAFAAGRLSAPAAATTGFRGTGQLPGSVQAAGDGQLPGSGQVAPDGQAMPGRGGFGGGMSLQGTVTEVTAETITIELESGTPVTIPVDSATTYRTASPASAAAVAVGSEVAITPGARIADPSASVDPGAAPGAGGGARGMSFGAASAVTVLEP